MNHMIVALILSLKDIFKILVIMVVVVLIFANMGTILYRDTFTYCKDPVNFYVTEEECSENNEKWIHYR